MTRQYIDIGGMWGVVVYHGTTGHDEKELRNALEGLHCPPDDIEQAVNVVKRPDTGFTFSLPSARMSVVAIAQATSRGEYVNTIAHECKHIVTAIARHYGQDEGDEPSAHLLGNLVMRMVEWVS